jgi:hypothetical protein
VNLFDQVLDRDVDSTMTRAIKHLNDLSRLPFRQQIGLQITR